MPIQARAISDFDGVVAVAERDKRLRVGTDQEIIVPTVVVPLKFDKFRFASVAACQANGRHCRFGTSVSETHPFGGWHHLLDQLRDLNLDLGRCREMCATPHTPADHYDDPSVCVP